MTQDNKRFALPKSESGGSNMPLLLIATAFLCVTIVLALLQPGLDPTKAAFETATAPTKPKAASVEKPVQEDVTRTQVPLLTKPPTYRTTAAYIAGELTAPLDLNAADPQDLSLPALARAVVAQFSPNEAPDRLLVALIVESIQQRQSDAYFNILLNTAAARDRFVVPRALETPAGGIDGPALLQALARAAGGNADAKIQKVNLSGLHIVGPADSLAGIAHRYYGRPEAYPVIIDANPSLRTQNLQLTEGQELQLPQG